ncbi:GNAT family N-acetyltransferase [Myxococcaceae bacterium JPH2]|nr:GNAT family N-acetyltransferase [Myxococcaceae bacterium JPH2]
MDTLDEQQAQEPVTQATPSGSVPAVEPPVPREVPLAPPSNEVRPSHSRSEFFDTTPGARTVPASLSVTEARTYSAFAGLRAEWTALLTRTDDQLFYRHEFIDAWLTHFASDARFRVLTARDSGGRLRAVLPLLERRTWCAGAPVRQLISPTNAHSCRFDMLAEDAPAAGAAFLRHLESDPEWDLLQLQDVPHGGRAWSLYRAAEERGLPVGTWKSMDSPYLLLPASLPELHARWSKNLRSGLRRRRKRLDELGPVTVERVCGGEQLDARLSEGFAIERGGWKGERGTAISQDPATLGFYTRLARDAADSGHLSLYMLRSAGRAIAFDFAFAYQGRYLTLKPAYDEAFQQYSPGQLLTAAALEDGVSSGLTECDLLGENMPCKAVWADRLRPHSWLFVFRDTRFGRALCSAKFRWLPAARRMVTRWVPTR